MKLIAALFLICFPAASFAQTKGALENPSPDSNTSGIYMFSGWACDAELIEIVIDGSSGLKAAYGTSRGDTLSVCGDTDNGFGLLFNFALLGTGEHEAVVFADGLEIGRSTFTVQSLSTGEFLRDANGFSIVNNFPTDGQESWLVWTQSAQNFAVAYEQAAVNPFAVEGVWADQDNLRIINISTSRIYADRTEARLTVGGLSSDGPATQNFEGYIVGKVGRFYSSSLGLLPSPEGDLTVNFTDPLNGTIEIDSCDSSGSDADCLYESGDTASISKVDGPNTGEGGSDDGTPPAPYGGD